MLHFHSLEGLELHNTWATIGMFDGVHVGHQSILAPLAQDAHAADCQAAVLTFFPHPVEVLRGTQEALYLTTPEERAEQMGRLGIDTVITLAFTRELAATSAGAFIQKLCDHLGMRQLWVGSDFALGRDRQGDIPTLRRLGEELGYSVKVISEVTVGSARVSSSQIRALIKAGQVDQAAQALGRLYSLEGPVVLGDQRGRQLGFPTANLAPWPQKVLPANGVYATWAWVNDQRLQAVTNVGTRPTFAGVEKRIEAHLIDFNQDIYGQPLKLEFVELLRPEQRFVSIDALIAQITFDKQRAQERLANEP